MISLFTIQNSKCGHQNWFIASETGIRSDHDFGFFSSYELDRLENAC